MKKDRKWSFTRWQMFNACPAQYEWHYLFRKPRLPSPAMDRGIKIHKLAEDYVKGSIKRLPPELKRFANEFKILKAEYKKGIGFTEPDVSINSLLKRSNRMGTDWLIAFADFIHFDNDTCTIIDYKTGRPYDKHRDQGHLYAMACLFSEPELKNIDVEFWYLDTGQTKDFFWHRGNLENMLGIWEKRTEPMFTAKKFPKKRNKFCSSCARNKKNGGDCNG